MDEKDKEIALLKHQLNRLRCFMWLHKTNFKTRRKLTNIDIGITLTRRIRNN